MRSALLVLAMTAATLSAAPARWGSDPSSAAAAGNSLRETTSAFAAGNNPALLGVEDRASFGVGFTSASFRWNALNGVVVDSPDFRVEDGKLRRADVAPIDAGLTSMALGIRVPIRSSVRWLPPMGIGISASGPLSTLRRFRASTPYDFAPLRYGTADGQFKATVGASAAVIDRHLYFGAGLDVFVTAAGNADIAVGGVEPVGRFAMDVGWNTAMVLGAFWKDDRQSAALTYRQRIQPRLRQEFLGTVAVGGADVAAIPLELEAMMYGEPETIDVEFGRRFGPFVVAAGLRWERWEGIETSALNVRATLPNAEHRATRRDLVRLHDTLSPALSVGFAPNADWTISSGYRWSPSPLGDTSGPANVLDAGTHIVGLGVSQKLAASEFLPCPVKWSLTLQRHWAPDVVVTKTRANAIGAPGYTLSGSGFGVNAGLELSL